MTKRCASPVPAASTPRSLIGLGMLATWLPLEESQRALALFDEAIEVGTRIGDRMASRSRCAAKRGSRPDVATGEQPSKRAVDSAEQTLELGSCGRE